MGLTDERKACTFVAHAQGRRLRSCEPAEQQDARWHQGPTQLYCEMSERLLQDVRNYQVEPRTPIVGRFTAELDPYGVRVQCRMCFGTRQCKWIDVGAHDELSTSGSGDPGEDSCARTDIQNCFRPPLSAKEVHGPCAEGGRRMGAVPEARCARYFLRKLGQGQRALRQA